MLRNRSKIAFLNLGASGPEGWARKLVKEPKGFKGLKGTKGPVRTVVEGNMRSGRKVSQKAGFSFVEVLFVVTFLGILISMVYPSASVMIEKSRYMECQRRLDLIKRAKSGYAVDHPGYMSVVGENEWNAFQMYFWAPVKFRCPRVPEGDPRGVYDKETIKNLFSTTGCPYCVNNPMTVN